jgi:hypothetical protein
MRILISVKMRMISPTIRFPVVKAMVNKKNEYKRTGINK